jgi:Ca-activated chloride channel family protein
MRRAFRFCARHGLTATALAVVVALAVTTWLAGWNALWATPDQRGAWLFARGRFAEAADRFADPMWRGVALMRAGKFSDAAASFANADTAAAAYDRGNALIMLGQYPEAVAQYDRALSLRTGWADAIANRALAQLRADHFAHLQGELADQESAKVDEAYRRDRTRQQADGQPNAPAAIEMSDASIHALWLRRVQTRPADFLRARFAFQLQQADSATAAGKPPQ